MPITQLSNIPLHLRGMYDAITVQSKTQPDFQKHIGHSINTKQLYETMALVAGIGNAKQKEDGGSTHTETPRLAYKKAFRPIISAIGVDYTPRAMKNDQYGYLTTSAIDEAIGVAHYKQRQIVGAGLLINATSASYPCVDGVALASASHPYDGGTFTNISTAATLSVYSLETMLQDRWAHKDLKGGQWTDMGQSMLIVPPALQFRALRIAKSQGMPGSMNQDANQVGQFLTEVVVNPYLTNTTAYFLVPTGANNKMYWLEGQAMQFAEDTPDPRTGVKVRLAEWDYTPFVMLAQGTQYNAGA